MPSIKDRIKWLEMHRSYINDMTEIRSRLAELEEINRLLLRHLNLDTEKSRLCLKDLKIKS